MTEPNILAIQKELRELETMYSEKPSADTTNFFITGESGSGKTVMCSTAPAPILIDSFDPRGTESIEEEIKKGRVFVDTRWEQDDQKNPKTYDEWEKTFFQRKRIGMFDSLGTYVIDSSTGLLNVAMNKVLKREGRPGGVPQRNDYLPQMTLIQNALNVIAALPCNVIMTNHLNTIEIDERLTIFRPLITGMLKIRIPLLFSEIYVLETKQGARSVERWALTEATGRYMARTRIGRGVFEPRETPNISALLKKAGKPFADKEIK